MDIDLNLKLGFDDIKQESSDSPEPTNLGSQSSMPDDVGVSNLMSIADEIEKKLEVGCIVETLDLVFLLYCEYAHAKGFSVKKGDQRYFIGTRDVKSKEFECSCEGFLDRKRAEEDNIGIFQKRVTRTNCKAKIRVAREKNDDPWKVSRFVKDHNHEMVSPDQSYLLRSSRILSHSKKTVLEALHSVGIRVSSVINFMENESSGPQNVGFTRKDAYNYIERLRKETKVKNGDANALLKFFIDKSNTEHLFYWNVQLDDDDRLMNFFFRDSRSAIDYEYFGDVVSFDTTYRTNKYNMICAPFVGINHHMKNVMFGMAFLSDETTSTFEWLFNTFLDSMNRKEPGVIFSDQDRAIMNAIDSVFPNSYHRLCQWHINQNAPSYFGSLNCDFSFKKLWHTCMNKCTSVDEFESLWKSIIEAYNLIDHKWFQGMYKLRHRWASAFTNDRFSAGLLATSRSEVTNKVFKEMCTRTMSPYDFVLHYERVQSSWRVKERAEDTYCLSKPGQFLKNNILLNHAAAVYTHNVYKDFQIQFVNSMNTVFVDHPLDYNARMIYFQFFSNSPGSSIRNVIFNSDSHSVTCSCHRWETYGKFCKHILKVYNTMNVTRIPEQYILKRLTTQAKQRNLTSAAPLPPNPSDIDPVSEMTFVNQIMRSMYELTQSSKCHAGARHLIRTRIDKLNKDVGSLLSTIHHNRLGNEGPFNRYDAAEFGIRDPPMTKTKCSKNKKVKSHWDTNKGKGKIKVSNVNLDQKERKHSTPMDQVHASQQQLGSSDELSYTIPPGHDYQFQSSQSSNADVSRGFWQSLYVDGRMDNIIYESTENSNFEL